MSECIAFFDLVDGACASGLCGGCACYGDGELLVDAYEVALEVVYLLDCANADAVAP